MDAFIERNSQDQIQQIQESLGLSIQRITKDAAGDKSVSTGYVNAISSFIYQFASMCISRDLIAFKDHAGRKSISEDDALLLSRKTKYHDHLIEYLEDLGFTPKVQAKGRKKK
ncbi:hypothetical protein M9Y10_036374 [Tritrichomonas musculus]|uniref:Uncharacterized protein n=1 Tax=Tritrichomonas musculus TaxID=1915356 RepID=A0ABR2GVD9_9EUKA